MLSISKFALLLVFLVSVLFAAKPAGTLSTSGAVIISGTRMSAATVSFWPVASGDEIATLDSPAVLILPDKSRIALGQNSKGKLVADGNRLTFELVSGSVDYNLVSPMSAIVLAGGRLISESSGSAGKQVRTDPDDGSRRPHDPPPHPAHPPHPSPVL
ncbi:MAG: hypothetical protein M3O35_13690 [Acidobacteriota bacterium]|nr:hypothetical protein [Acidobacteriota bacterium]